MPPMASQQPGDAPRPSTGPAGRADGAETMGRRLDAPPSDRYGDAPGTGTERANTKASAAGPLARATIAAVVGAAALVLVGAVLASTAGLLFVAGVTGAAIGLVLARARVPGADGASPALDSAAVTWLAVSLALAAVVVAAIGTWVIARGEGGVLGPIDYLLETFGPFVPAEAVVAALTAAWGASAGPIQR